MFCQGPLVRGAFHASILFVACRLTKTPDRTFCKACAELEFEMCELADACRSSCALTQNSSRASSNDCDLIRLRTDHSVAGDSVHLTQASHMIPRKVTILQMIWTACQNGKTYGQRKKRFVPCAMCATCTSPCHLQYTSVAHILRLLNHAQKWRNGSCATRLATCAH